MYLLGLGFLFWTTTILMGLGFFLMLIGFIAQIIFIIRYSEKIRHIAINMPGYQPSWGFITNFDKPIRAWDIVGSNLFMMRLIGIIHAKRTTPINEEFKSLLPPQVIRYITWSFRAGTTAVILILLSWGISHLQ